MFYKNSGILNNYLSEYLIIIWCIADGFVIPFVRIKLYLVHHEFPAYYLNMWKFKWSSKYTILVFF